MDEVEELRREVLAQFDESEGELKARFAPGSFGCHEALHMASFLMQAVDDELMGHGAIVTNPEWFALAHQGFASLHELYNAIGRVHLANPPSAAGKDSE